MVNLDILAKGQGLPRGSLPLRTGIKISVTGIKIPTEIHSLGRSPQNVNEKLISQFKKEMEDFIWAKLRIITRDQHLRKLQELLCPLEVKAQVMFFETEGCTLNDVLVTVYTIQIQVPLWPLTRSRSMVSFTELLVLGECCSLWLSRYFCWWGRFDQCIMQTHSVQSREERSPKGREFFPLNFSCLVIKWGFYFVIVSVFFFLMRHRWHTWEEATNTYRKSSVGLQGTERYQSHLLERICFWMAAWNGTFLIGGNWRLTWARREMSLCWTPSYWDCNGGSAVIQLLSHVDSWWPHGLQHARFPCPSPSPRVCSNSCIFRQMRHVANILSLFFFVNFMIS